MWHSYPVERNGKMWTYTLGPIAIQIYRHRNGDFFVSCQLFGVINKPVESKGMDEAAALKACIDHVISKAAELMDLCREAQTKINAGHTQPT